MKFLRSFFTAYLIVASCLFTQNFVLDFQASAQIRTPSKELFLSPEELAYIQNSSVIKAGSVDRVAPLSYLDEKGKPQGIFMQLFDEIADISGLTFEYELYSSVEELFNSDVVVVVGISPNYVTSDVLLTKPFLETEAIVYLNSSVEPSELANKVFAGIKGGILPDGIKEENVIYFDSREESLNAVESGLADYGYGNTFSVAYYSLLNGYKNIITIPRGIEPREYGIAIKSDDLILVSILNKSIDLIDPNQLHAVILEASTKIDRKITFSMIMDEYWIEISISVGLVFSIILISFLYNLRTNKQLKLQNKKYEALAHISNEFLYQYDFTSDNFQVSYQGRELFNSESDLYKAISILREALKNLDAENCNMNIRVPLENGEVKVLRSINYCVMDERKHIVSIIGKLSDISKEEAEKEDLLFKAQIDGLTCLYNAETTRKLISERLDFVGDGEQDAFILIDCDDFKEINDSYGHLTGNTVLKKLAEVLKAAFRKADIIGRIGGDEFCVYMMKIPSVDFVKQRFEGLDTPFVTVSTGIVLINEQCSFEEMFKKADEALYQAKGSGKGKVVIYEEKKGNRL